MTVPEAIKELEKIEMTRQTNKVYRLNHAVTAKQKKILKAFGMNEGKHYLRAREIMQYLQSKSKRSDHMLLEHYLAVRYGDIIVFLYHEDMQSVVVYYSIIVREKSY